MSRLLPLPTGLSNGLRIIYRPFSTYNIRMAEMTIKPLHLDQLKSNVNFKKHPWGLLTSIDLFSCNPDLIRSRQSIAQYAREVCDIIKMKKYGDPIIVRFGEDKRVLGYSLVQLIQTSSIVGHFCEAENSSFIDIFSCAPYSPELVRDFSVDFSRLNNGKLVVCLEDKLIEL